MIANVVMRMGVSAVCEVSEARTLMRSSRAAQRAAALGRSVFCLACKPQIQGGLKVEGWSLDEMKSRPAGARCRVSPKSLGQQAKVEQSQFPHVEGGASRGRLRSALAASCCTN